MIPYLVRWTVIALLVGVLAGSASALLLWSLELATATRESHRWLIALLPLAGFSVGLLYHYFGRSVEAGNNLLLEEIHDPKAVIPVRMTPLVLLGTFVSHLFGGSAGREGTALQTGASLADQLTRPLGLDARDRRVLLMAGISAGFGSVFGTPLAGAVFGLEVLAIGKMRYDALIPCFLAAIVGDRVTMLWGIHHTVYRIRFVPKPDLAAFGAAIVAGVVFGCTGMLFAKTTHAIAKAAKRFVHYAPLRPVIGGTVVAVAVFVLGTTKYLGLGIPTILAAFANPLPPWDFAAKFLFTAVTLGSGFKGGEVTPLFFIGATLGNALGYVLPIPFPLLAGMGFCAVFAGAANTPISSTLLGMELFGSEAGIYLGIASVISYLFSGHAGIYGAQRIGLSKHSAREHEEGLTLAAVPGFRIVPDFDLQHDLPAAHSPSREVSILRLYFHVSAKSRSLGKYLLRQAKDAGIEQAVLHCVSAGFLRGEKISEHLGEIAPSKLPQCLELIAEEDLLKAFLEVERPHLKHARAVLLRPQDVA